MVTTQNFEQLMNLFHNIKIGCLVAAIIFLAAAIALFFLLKIPNVFSELTGRGAKKAIEEMTAENSSGNLASSRKIGEDGRRHRRRAFTASLNTVKLRKNTSHLSSGLTGEMQDPRNRPDTSQSAQPIGTAPGNRFDTSQGVQPIGTAPGNSPDTSQGVQPIAAAPGTMQDTGAGTLSRATVSPQDDSMERTTASGANETTIMDSGAGETTVMKSDTDETTTMDVGAGETTVMKHGAGETTAASGGARGTATTDVGTDSAAMTNGDMGETTAMGGSANGAAAIRSSGQAAELEETLVLSQEMKAETASAPQPRADTIFKIERSIVEIHTDEVI